VDLKNIQKFYVTVPSAKLMLFYCCFMWPQTNNKTIKLQ